MKLIIAGSRDFENYVLLKQTVEAITSKEKVSEIVSGGCHGADKLGEQYAKEKGLPIKYFIPDWKTHGKYAGVLRNTDMAKYADALIAFWDGESKGTQHMIAVAKEKNLAVRVKKITKQDKGKF